MYLYLYLIYIYIYHYFVSLSSQHIASCKSRISQRYSAWGYPNGIPWEYTLWGSRRPWVPRVANRNLPKNGKSSNPKWEQNTKHVKIRTNVKNTVHHTAQPQTVQSLKEQRTAKENNQHNSFGDAFSLFFMFQWCSCDLWVIFRWCFAYVLFFP